MEGVDTFVTLVARWRASHWWQMIWTGPFFEKKGVQWGYASILHNLKSPIRLPLGPLVHGWFKNTKTIPCVQVNTMSCCKYHELLSIPWVHIYTMSPCQYHESMSIPWFHVYTMSPCLYHESFLLTRIIINTMTQKFELQKYQKLGYTNYRIEEMHV